MSCLSVRPLMTRIFDASQDLTKFICESVSHEHVADGMILAVTSKIVSLAENRLVPRANIDKASLVRREADVFLGEIGHGCFLTIKEGLFIPSAGIDESNSRHGDFILYPENPLASAQGLWRVLREAWGLNNLGIILTDSRTSPLRRGVTGVSLAHWGFHALRGMVGSADLFGRELKMTNMNLADGLASAAVLMMGEGRECRPLAVINGAEVEFCDQTDPGAVKMPPDEDLYSPFFRNFK